MATLIANFSLDSEKDKDVIRWLDAQSNRSAAIRAAIRDHMAKAEGVTLADVLAEVRALPSRLSAVAVTSEATAQGEEEPQAAAANLDGLLNRLGNGDLG
jgi:cell pole-organizing protein PopZ